jgi:hypothetical protein
MKTTLDRLPEIYLNESRDFQLLARLWSMLYLGKMQKAVSILQLIDPLTCPEQYLDLLRERYGFNPSIEIPPAKMRIILKAFPYLIRNKGSVRAIETAVRIALLLQGINPNTLVIIANELNAELQIYIDREIDDSILSEIFKHVAPVGFTYTLMLSSLKEHLTSMSGDSAVFVATTTTQTLSSIINQETFEDGAPALDTWAVGALGIQEITNTNDDIETERKMIQHVDNGELPQT